MHRPVVALLLVTLPPPPHAPITDSQDVAACHHFNFPAIARKITSCTLIMRSLFEAPTVAGLAMAVVKFLIEEAYPAEKTHMLDELERLSKAGCPDGE